MCMGRRSFCAINTETKTDIAQLVGNVHLTSETFVGKPWTEVSSINTNTGLHVAFMYKAYSIQDKKVPHKVFLCYFFNFLVVPTNLCL